jgi:hypothetical protein
MESIMSEKVTGSKKVVIWKFLLFFAFAILLGGSFMRYVMKDSLGDVLGFSILMSVSLLLVFLGNRYPAFGPVITRMFGAYMLFLLWMVITLAPVTGLYLLSPIILNKLRMSFQIVVFVVWGLLLMLAVWLVATETNRERFLKPLRELSLFAPVAYAFNVLMIAILFFSSVTYVLVNHGVLKLNAPAGAQGVQISPEVIRDFYSWHFLNAVPALKVNETLHWKEPLTYESGWVVVVLLLFQLTVIVPVIAAFAWREKSKPQPENSKEDTSNI